MVAEQGEPKGQQDQITSSANFKQHEEQKTIEERLSPLEDLKDKGLLLKYYNIERAN